MVRPVGTGLRQIGVAEASRRLCPLVLLLLTFIVPATAGAQCFTDPQNGARACPDDSDPPSQPRAPSRQEPRRSRDDSDRRERDKNAEAARKAEEQAAKKVRQAQEKAVNKARGKIREADAKYKDGYTTMAIQLTQEAVSILEAAGVNASDLRAWIAKAEREVAERQLEVEYDAAYSRRDYQRALTLFTRLVTYDDTPANRQELARLQKLAADQEHERTAPAAAPRAVDATAGAVEAQRRVQRALAGIDPTQAFADSARSGASTHAGVVATQSSAGDSVARNSPNSDASVVDARGLVRDGQDLIAQVPELARSPAASQIMKGYQGVIAHDWPVALGWWRQALLADPDNAALQRSVQLAEWMIKWKQVMVDRQNDPLQVPLSYAAKGGSPLIAAMMLSDAMRQNPGAKADAALRALDLQLGENPEYRQARKKYIEQRLQLPTDADLEEFFDFVNTPLQPYPVPLNHIQRPEDSDLDLLFSPAPSKVPNSDKLDFK